jgi:twitching motility protein PilT
VEYDLTRLLVSVAERGGSDLHLTAGLPPVARIDGSLVPFEGRDLTPNDTRELVYSVMSQQQREALETGWEEDFACSVPATGRFRVNAYYQRGAVGAAFRFIPNRIMGFDELGLPTPVMESLSLRPRGLVLVTGPTGSGKSTTLAAMVDFINDRQSLHVMTVEDPIEYLHSHRNCMINQREVGDDTHSFGDALKYVLRQDPDVILIGEMRDLETVSAALTAAETGHLVLATLHTQDAVQTIDRVVDVFPPHQQQQVRTQLAATMQGVICQQLLPMSRGKGRVLAVEVMLANPAVRNLIREGKTHLVPQAVETGRKFGMVTMDQSLVDLVRRDKVTSETALSRAADPNGVREALGMSA